VAATANVHSKSRLLPALLVSLCACAPLPETALELPAPATAVELDATPFFPQQRYQCGPAALATVLSASGVVASPEALEDKVYVPGREGSLQLELLAATRSEGRLPYVIDDTLAAAWRELSAGRPVLVLQNLGIAAIPRWHYAVVVGIDAKRGEVVLRSGTDRRRVTGVKTFLRTWRRSDYWGMVVLRPDELPATVDRDRYFAAIAALEQTGHAALAETAWRTAADAFPGDTVPMFGLANAQMALGEHAAAAATYRVLLARDAGLVAARNNLALVLAEQGLFDAAIEEIERALARNGDPALEAELRDTLATIARMRKQAD